MRCCSHLSEINSVTPKTPNGCDECLKMGDRWVICDFAQPVVTLGAVMNNE